MDKRKMALRLIMNDLQLRLDDFNDRLTFQKSIYSLQALGLNLNYHFSWYLRGPYSPGLTADGFEVADPESVVAREAREYRLSPQIQEVLRRLQEIEGRRPNDVPDTATWLEILVSLHYLAKNYGLEDEELIRVLIEKKPYIQRYIGAARQAPQQLREYGLID